MRTEKTTGDDKEQKGNKGLSAYEHQLLIYKSQMSVIPREKKILETIQKSQERFILCEQEQAVPYFDFLAAQLRLIGKRWWILQALMLGIVAAFLPYMQYRIHMLRTLSVVGVLFVVLMIPEFWKNKSHDSMQVEGACLYSLRQIYAARMIWFGLIDMLILTCFYLIARGKLGLATGEIVIQFLFPMLVAACICFGTLCSNTLINEGAAILCCLLWSAVWCLIIMNDAVYRAITVPVWTALFVFFLAFLAGAVYRTIHDCNECMGNAGRWLTLGK